MATKAESQIQRHPFFAQNPVPDGILIPETPVLLQANCAQKGSWVLGEKNLGNDPIDCYLVGFQFSKEYDPYKETEVMWTIVHFVPTKCDFLKPNLVYTTKIKNMASNRKGSLFNLGNKMAEIISTGLDPREVKWSMKFVPKSGMLPSGEMFQCSVVDFDYTQIPSAEIEPIIPVLTEVEKIAQLTIAAMASDAVPAIAASATTEVQTKQLEAAKA